MAFQTEYNFELPKGYVDNDGNLHKRGVMRLATAADEILPQKDPRVQSNPSYLTVVLLARVITKLGELRAVDTKTIENLFTSDFAYLQDLYNRINQLDTPTYDAVCPHCGNKFGLQVDFFQQSE